MTGTRLVRRSNWADPVDIKLKNVAAAKAATTSLRYRILISTVLSQNYGGVIIPAFV